MNRSTQRVAHTPDGPERLRIRLQWDQIRKSGRPAQLKVALLATFTVNPLAPYLGMALEQTTTHADLWIGQYNQIIPQCLSADSELMRYKPDLLVVWLRLEELWGAQPLPLTDAPATYAETAMEVADACLDAAQRCGATLVFVLPALPELRPLGVGDACSPIAVTATATTVREQLRRHLAGQPGVLLVDAEDIVRRVGSLRAYNHRTLAVARIPFSEEVFCLLGQRLAHLITLSQAPSRLVAIDPDNVLWGGTIEGQGPKGVDLNEGGPGEIYRQVQAWLLELQRAGTRLTLCGSYAEADIWQAFARREMRLKQADVAGWQFRPCVQAVRELAEDLNVDVDRFVVITANADVRAELEQTLPGAHCIVMPDDPAEWISVLPESGLLDLLPPSTQAPALPEPAVRPDEQRGGGNTLSNFLARLALDVRLYAVEPQQIEHIAHLTQHTSDFHLTGTQRSSDDITAFLSCNTAECFAIDVHDRLGDYGVAGTIFFQVEADILRVDTFLLNCRVLGRNVEYIVLSRLAAIARERGCTQVQLEYRRTARNAIAGEFVKAVAGGALQQELNGFSARLPIETLAALTAHGTPISSCSLAPTTTMPPERSQNTASPAAAFVTACWHKLGAERQASLLTTIATQYQNSQQILAAVRKRHCRARPHLKEDFVAPRTALEAQLVEVWAHVLGIERVGVRDNFFHLGGHSILATQLVIQLQQKIGVELPVRIFFETPTVESMAQAIEVIRRTGDDTAFVADAPTYIKAEATLDPTIVPDHARPAEYSSDPRAIFLTGATGFLGAFLLYELLRRTHATIYCLVRANDAEAGKARIRQNLEAYSLWDAASSARVIPVLGDLGQPLLGLAEERFLELADTIDVIYHAGANTSFIYPYSTLKATNVLGTQEVLRLASRIKLKPVHFTSTLYVFAPLDRPADRAIAEEDRPEHIDTLHIGYRQSKWVAEQLMLIARDRGLPVCIYRPGRIAGHSQTGACQTNDFVWRMIKACVEAGSVLTQDMLMDMAPVDYVTQAITHLSLQPTSLGKIFHLINARPPYLQQVVEWMRAYGYSIRQEAYDVWRGQLKAAAQRGRESAAYAMIPFLPETLAEDQLGDLPFDQHNALAGLADSAITCPRIDRRLFHTYLDYFIRNGFLEPPHRLSAQPASVLPADELQHSELAYMAAATG